MSMDFQNRHCAEMENSMCGYPHNLGFNCSQPENLFALISLPAQEESSAGVWTINHGNQPHFSSYMCFDDQNDCSQGEKNQNSTGYLQNSSGDENSASFLVSGVTELPKYFPSVTEVSGSVHVDSHMKADDQRRFTKRKFEAAQGRMLHKKKNMKGDGENYEVDSQVLYARRRREKINEKLRVLQSLVPNGNKVDISTMLEQAILYVKFLQLQIKERRQLVKIQARSKTKVCRNGLTSGHIITQEQKLICQSLVAFLISEELWMYAPLTYNGMTFELESELAVLLELQAKTKT